MLLSVITLIVILLTDVSSKDRKVNIILLLQIVILLNVILPNAILLIVAMLNAIAPIKPGKTIYAPYYKPERYHDYQSMPFDITTLRRIKC